MTALQDGRAAIWDERRCPVIPGCIEQERTVGVVRRGVRRGGRVGVRRGRFVA
jgi:hypothetical protein